MRSGDGLGKAGERKRNGSKKGHEGGIAKPVPNVGSEPLQTFTRGLPKKAAGKIPADLDVSSFIHPRERRRNGRCAECFSGGEKGVGKWKSQSWRWGACHDLLSSSVIEKKKTGEEKNYVTERRILQEGRNQKG